MDFNLIHYYQPRGGWSAWLAPIDGTYTCCSEPGVGPCRAPRLLLGFEDEVVTHGVGTVTGTKLLGCAGAKVGNAIPEGFQLGGSLETDTHFVSLPLKRCWTRNLESESAHYGIDALYRRSL
jgi:hypothetical protein